MLYYYRSSQDAMSHKLELIESKGDEYVAKPIDAIHIVNNENYGPYQTFTSLLPLDANLDGRMDFYSCEGDHAHFIHYRQPDGSYLKTPMQIITDTAGLDEETKQWMNATAYLKGSYQIRIEQGGLSMIGGIQKGDFQYIDTP